MRQATPSCAEPSDTCKLEHFKKNQNHEKVPLPQARQLPSFWGHSHKAQAPGHKTWGTGSQQPMWEQTHSPGSSSFLSFQPKTSSRSGRTVLSVQWERQGQMAFLVWKPDHQRGQTRPTPWGGQEAHVLSGPHWGGKSCQCFQQPKSHFRPLSHYSSGRGRHEESPTHGNRSPQFRIKPDFYTKHNDTGENWNV